MAQVADVVGGDAADIHADLPALRRLKRLHTAGEGIMDGQHGGKRGIFSSRTTA